MWSVYILPAITISVNIARSPISITSSLTFGSTLRIWYTVPDIQVSIELTCIYLEGPASLQRFSSCWLWRSLRFASLSKCYGFCCKSLLQMCCQNWLHATFSVLHVRQQSIPSTCKLFSDWLSNSMAAFFRASSDPRDSLGTTSLWRINDVMFFSYFWAKFSEVTDGGAKHQEWMSQSLWATMNEYCKYLCFEPHLPSAAFPIMQRFLHLNCAQLLLPDSQDISANVIEVFLN